MYVNDMKINGALRTPIMKEIPSVKELAIKKGTVRKLIEDKVFDINDSVADNAKLISLLISVVSRIWSMQSEEQRGSLPQEEQDMINYFAAAFQNTQTRADVQFANEGVGLIDRLLTKQSDIGKIIKDEL